MPISFSVDILLLFIVLFRYFRVYFNVVPTFIHRRFTNYFVMLMTTNVYVFTHRGTTKALICIM